MTAAHPANIIYRVNARRDREAGRGERAAILRWRRGLQKAAARQRVLMTEEGPRPEQAVGECLSALNALAEMGLWPGPRDPVSERAVELVRRRWARIERRARQAHRR